MNTIMQWLRALPDEVWSTDQLILRRQQELAAEEAQAKRLRDDILRLKAEGITQKSIAYDAGVSPSTLSLIVRGHERFPIAFDAVRRVVDRRLARIPAD